ncbi:MAG: hypothetical protein ACLP1X_01585 [Polyangiaceae bacterium]|jgi:hypothetical protein
MRLSSAFAIACALLLSSALARAEPLFGWGENSLEDAYLDGDLDEEDHVAMRIGGHVGASDVHGESWLSIVGFTRELQSGKNDLGAFLVVGLALDRLAAGPVHRLSDPPRPQGPPATTPLPAALPARTNERALETLAGGASLAHECVAAAWRTSGLGVDDARIDDIVSRSRTSALLPETRVRAMRLWDDAAHTTTVTSEDGTTFYDAIGANLVLELRLTWRLDRLVYAGDEPTLERVRLEREEARSRMATRTLEALFAWERATVDVAEAIAGSHEELAAHLRSAEAMATLDVLTGGWASEHLDPDLSRR